jgi:lipopolysaccharide export system protein LptA
MWTPRRVLLLALGAAVFAGAYVTYAAALGALDGLPPLPDEYLEPLDPQKHPPATVVIDKPVDLKLRQAFGPDCQETSYTIKLNIQSKNLLLAADNYDILDDGRVMLWPFSLAVYGKGRGKDGWPEINTIHCDRAIATFEKPIQQPSDMGRLRIVAAELNSEPEPNTSDRRSGRVWLGSNRKSATDADDVVMNTVGPIYYHEDGRPDAAGPDKPHIWTTAPVSLLDRQSRPEPTTITATGMNVHLLIEPKPGPLAGKDKDKAKEKDAAPLRPDNGTVSGARRIELLAHVRMSLQVDSGGFLAAGKPPAAAGGPAKPGDKPAKPGDKARVEITTPGTFRYDLPQEKGRFTALPPGRAGHLPNQVLVHRFGKDGANDQLICEVLDLQFRRKPVAVPKPGTPAPEADGGGVDLEIEEAHATGPNVALSSDSEELAAFGNDLVYNSATQRSVLKGSPHMTAMKDGSIIKAPTLVLSGVQTKDRQEAQAVGPGEVVMPDRQTGKPTLAAHWSDTMVFRKEVFDGRTLDAITLTGRADFLDKEHAQSLRADEIKVWLEPAAPKAPAPAGGRKPSEPKAGSGQRPYRLKAVGRVTAQSPDLNVHDTDYLVVWFRDAVTTRPAAPAPAAPAAPAAVPGKTAPPVVTLNPPTVPAPTPVPGVPTRPAPTATTKKGPPRPIDLTAHSVESFVIRRGEENDLDRLVCEGRVKVHQDPAPNEQRGVDITGDTLRLSHSRDGDILDVVGTRPAPGEVHLEKLSLVGPLVHIDQRENNAAVKGAGSMRMLSSTDFEGREKPKATPMTVHWTDEMFFDGKFAIFEGGVQAEQDTGRIACRAMQVFLDRAVSLKQADPAARRDPKDGKGEAAKVAKVVCDSQGDAKAPVVVIDEVRQKGRLAKFSRVVSPELSFDNAEGETHVPGPGVVTIVQAGGSDDPAGPAGLAARPGAAPARPAAPPGEPVMKLTRVQFQGKMFADNRKRTAKFFDNVRVVHAPGDDPEKQVDLDKLPPGGMFLKSETLEVYTFTEGGKSTQEMEARGRAYVQTPEFYGQADVIKYVESKDMVILEGTDDNPAILYKLKPNRGEPTDATRARKFIYHRKTNDFESDGVKNAIIKQ